MRLPANTIITRDKITGYLLVPQEHGDKSGYLAQAGYTQENADQLLCDLRVQILAQEAIPAEFNKFGQFYEISGTLTGPNGVMLGVRTIWMTAIQMAWHLSGITKIVTDARQTEDMMKLELYKEAVLTCDLPAHRLKSGDIIKVVDQHVARDGTEGYSIEVFSAIGDTIAVTAVPATDLEPLREDEVLCARAR